MNESRSPRRLVAYGGLGLLLVASVIWALSSAGAVPAGTEAAARVEVQATPVAAGSEESPLPAESATQRIEPQQVPCTLKLRLVGADGAPCPGQIVYCASARPLQSLPVMDGISLACAKARAEVREFVTVAAPAGEAVVALAGPKYLWLHATGQQCGGRVYQRVAPFSGERVEILKLAGRRVHAMAWNEQMTYPAADREIECLVDDKRIATARTDANGYACIDGLSAGAVLVRLADGPPGEHTSARVRFGQQDAADDATVLLVAAGRQVDLRVQIEAEFAVERGFPPVLLLRRTEPGQDVVRCVTSTLSPGQSTWQVSLPPGLYEPVILPQGALAFAGGVPRIEVPDAEKADCHLALLASGRHRLELSGVDVDVQGVMVRLWREGDVADSANRRIWLGPSTWRRRRETVGAWDGVAYVVARNHAQLWISNQPVAAAQQDVVVVMVPGMELEVIAPPAAAANGESALVTQAGRETMRLFRTSMRSLPSGQEVVAHAILTLPWETVLVRRLDAHGAVLAERTLEPRHSVSVRL